MFSINGDKKTNKLKIFKILFYTLKKKLMLNHLKDLEISFTLVVDEC